MYRGGASAQPMNVVGTKPQTPKELAKNHYLKAYDAFSNDALRLDNKHDIITQTISSIKKIIVDNKIIKNNNVTSENNRIHWYLYESEKNLKKIEELMHQKLASQAIGGAAVKRSHNHGNGNGSRKRGNGNGSHTHGHGNGSRKNRNGKNGPVSKRPA
jgi:hypothetical protein